MGIQNGSSRSWYGLSNMGVKSHKYFMVKAAALSAFVVVAPSVAIAPSVDLSATPPVSKVITRTGTAEAAQPVTNMMVAHAPGIAAGLDVVNRAVTRVVKVAPGDTLMKIALANDMPRNEAHAAIQALGKVFNPRRLRPGHELTFTYLPKATSDETVELRGLRLDANAYQGYAAEHKEGVGFVPREVTKELQTNLVRSRGAMASNLFDSATAAGLPPAVLLELVRLYSWDVDFQRDIQPGDRFDVVFERTATVDGEFVRNGKIIYSRLVLSGAALPLYRHEFAPGRWDYFDDTGQSARKPLLRTPVDGARLSSRFGKRRHPILGYTRMHRGVDFAAPRGTPIYAAGDGRIVKRGWYKAYGRYIRIRHNATYDTAYAHMRAYKKGLKVGSRVKQGQIIGYVGSSGRSTGPHLHYEILKSGRQLNPLRVKLPSGRKLRGKALKTFKNARLAVDRRIATLQAPTKVASD